MRVSLVAMVLLAASAVSAGDGLMLLTPSHPLTEAGRAELATQGVTILEPLAGGRYVARVESDVADSRLVPLTAAMKVHPSAHRSSRSNIIVRRDVSFDEARQAVLAAGASLENPLETAFLPLRSVRAHLDAASLAALAADDRVLLIAGTIPYRIESDNQLTAQLSHVTDVQDPPYGLSGEGVTVATFESGVALASHPEFGGRLTTHGVGPTSALTEHTTHVAGTIGAAGLTPDARGMAPAVRIHQFCLERSYTGCTSDWLVDKDRELAPLGVVADNNSWSYRVGWSTVLREAVWNGAGEKYGAYDPLMTAPLDEISIARNVLFVHSAGNDGDPPQSFGPWFGHRHVDPSGEVIAGQMFCYSGDGSGTDCDAASCSGGCETVRHHQTLPFHTMSVTASGKNVIAVGAISFTQIGSFSSRGPARDGRVKPDLVAHGTAIKSLALNGYTRLSGTSMSTPVVTGIAALLTEQWRRTLAGATPTPAQLKALLLAGAQDLGNPGPDYTYGFGLVDAKKSVDLILADRGQGTHIRTLTITPEQTIEVRFVVAERQDVRVLVSWADPPALLLGNDAITTKALVNDLDLSVIDPTWTTLYPYVLDPERWTAPATTGINKVDNTEVVEIPTALPGEYRIRITGTSIAEGPQRAVLVSTAPMAVLPLPRRRSVR